MTFSGIPTAALDFYEDLEADNSKAFWTAHKADYDGFVRAPLLALIAELAPDLGEGKLFRPYRDVRFSKDKTLYKTHQGVWFDEARLYVHVDAAGLMVASGYYETSSAQVDRLRRSIADDIAGPLLERALSTVTRAGFEVGGDRITRVPSGYPKDHPRAELLKYKTLTAGKKFGCPPWLATADAKKEIVKARKQVEPLVSWLETHVGRG